MNDNTIEVLAAIVGIVILEGIAMTQGLDGVLLGGSVAIIAGLVGYRTGQITPPAC